MGIGTIIVIHLQAYPIPTSILRHTKSTDVFSYAQITVSSVVSVLLVLHLPGLQLPLSHRCSCG